MHPQRLNLMIFGFLSQHILWLFILLYTHSISRNLNGIPQKTDFNTSPPVQSAVLLWFGRVSTTRPVNQIASRGMFAAFGYHLVASIGWEPYWPLPMVCRSLLQGWKHLTIINFRPCSSWHDDFTVWFSVTVFLLERTSPGAQGRC